MLIQEQHLRTVIHRVKVAEILAYRKPTAQNQKAGSKVIENKLGLLRDCQETTIQQCDLVPLERVAC